MVTVKYHDPNGYPDFTAAKSKCYRGLGVHVQSIERALGYVARIKDKGLKQTYVGSLALFWQDEKKVKLERITRFDFQLGYDIKEEPDEIDRDELSWFIGWARRRVDDWFNLCSIISLAEKLNWINENRAGNLAFAIPDTITYGVETIGLGPKDGKLFMTMALSLASSVDGSGPTLDPFCLRILQYLDLDNNPNFRGCKILEQCKRT